MTRSSLIAVYDTYVKQPSGELLHFDILVPEQASKEQVLAYGNAYLIAKNLAASSMETARCSFCHVETPTPEILASISAKGFHILEL
jgi:Domain of unknown function (DUF2024)